MELLQYTSKGTFLNRLTIPCTRALDHAFCCVVLVALALNAYGAAPQSYNDMISAFAFLIDTRSPFLPFLFFFSFPSFTFALRPLPPSPITTSLILKG